MPELPEVQAVADFLDEQLTGARFARIDLASISALKTVVPALDAFDGRPVDAVRRRGKFLVLESHDDAGRLLLVVHLARAGWLQWRTEVPSAPPRPGKGPLVLRLTFIGAGGDLVGGADITEAGTRKGLAVWAVRSESDVPRLASLGPEPLDPAFTADSLASILKTAGGQQIKGVLRDQARIAGIGNAYSDEVLHVARLSPYAKCTSLDPEEVRALHEAIVSTLTDAIERSVGQQPALLKSEKRAGMRVHGRTGSPCPVCGDVVREVSFADSSLQYCPTCQTGGKPLADRRMSKLLK